MLGLRGTLCNKVVQRVPILIRLYALQAAQQDSPTQERTEVGQMEVGVFVPVMDRVRFAALTGLTNDTVRGWIEKGHLPTILIGKRRLINVAQLTKECVEQERE